MQRLENIVNNEVKNANQQRFSWKNNSVKPMLSGEAKYRVIKTECGTVSKETKHKVLLHATHKMTYKMKKILATLLLILSFNFVSNAQIFLIDDEIDNPRIPSDEFNIDNPGWHGSGEDWYTPIGDGALLLAALGGAYLVGKKKKNK